MPAVTTDQAVQMLTKQVEEKLDDDELLEVHNEIFPDDPYTSDEVAEDSSPLMEQLVEYIDGSLAKEEIVELWGLIFPEHRNVWYDEEAEKFHFNEEVEPQPAD